MDAIKVMVYNGRLMSPDEVRLATRDYGVMPREIRRSWVVCGDVSDELWLALRDTPWQKRGMRLSTFSTPTNTAYAVFVVQLGGRQARILLSLSDKSVVQLFAEGGATGIWLSMGRNDGDDTLLLEFFPSVPAQLQPVSFIARSCKTLSIEDARVEFQRAARAVMERETVPSLIQNCRVDEVSLTVILPDAIFGGTPGREHDR
jgi:hypothetical protein